ncbi:MAG: GapR family DNA-binding domain-containing protein [Hyphomicrobiaceae bacterium]
MNDTHAATGRLPAGESVAATNIGSNAEAELKRRIDRRVDLLDEVAELQGQLKEYRAEDKADGFTEAAIADAVKLRRADAEKVLRRILLEAEIDVYRKAAGLPVDIETAQKWAQEAAEAVPEAKKRGASGGRIASGDALGDNDDEVGQ